MEFGNAPGWAETLIWDLIHLEFGNYCFRTELVNIPRNENESKKLCKHRKLKSPFLDEKVQSPSRDVLNSARRILFRATHSRGNSCGMHVRLRKSILLRAALVSEFSNFGLAILV